MSEMKPLLDESVSPDVARLLRSAEKDGPESPESAEARTLAALATLPAAELGSSSSPARSLFGSFTRAGTLSAVAAVVVFGAAVAYRTTTIAPPTAPASPEQTPAVTTTTPAPPVPAAVYTVNVDELPTVAATAPDDSNGRTTAQRAPSAPKGPARPTLEDELGAIDAARGALASGDPDAALARVHDYQRKFRDGRFAEEAEALEVQALAALGRRAEARTKGARFLASHPGSPYERRVRSAIDSEEVKP